MLVIIVGPSWIPLGKAGPDPRADHARSGDLDKELALISATATSEIEESYRKSWIVDPLEQNLNDMESPLLTLGTRVT